MPVNLSQINISSTKKLIQDKLIEVCQTNQNLDKLEEAFNFFNSSFWINFRDRDSDSAHAFANEYLTQLVGSDKFAIYDKGSFLYDASNIESILSHDRLASLEYIDSSKLNGMYSSGRYTMMYIGSSVIFNMVSTTGEQTIEIEIIEENGYYNLNFQSVTTTTTSSGSVKTSYRWITFATLTIQLQFNNIIELIVKQVSSITMYSPGTYTVKITNLYTNSNGNTYYLNNQSFTTNNDVTFTINGENLTITVPNVSFKIANETYNLSYTEK